MSITVVINLFGGPGIRKTTMMSDLMAQMKWNGCNIEIAPEYAKTVVWDGNTDLLNDQLTIFAMQFRSINRLKGKVDYIVTDSPLALSLVYGKSNNMPKSFMDLVVDVHNQFINLNVILQRNPEDKYESVGRVHDLSQSIELDHEIESVVTSGLLSGPIIYTPVTKNSIDDIMKEAMNYHRIMSRVMNNSTNK